MTTTPHHHLATCAALFATAITACATPAGTTANSNAIGAPCAVPNAQACGWDGGFIRLTCTDTKWQSLGPCPPGATCELAPNNPPGTWSAVCTGNNLASDATATGSDGTATTSDGARTADTADTTTQPQCTSAATCDDAEPCTTDTCTNSQCQHAPIAGCGGLKPPCTVETKCPSGQVCSPTSHTCVGCASTADCGPNTRCDRGTCVPAVPCKGDLQCKAEGGVCDTAAGFCVPCLTSADCTGGMVCTTKCLVSGPCMNGLCYKCVEVSHVCAKSCSSSKDCPQVCSKTKGVCVACGSDADCPAEKWCDGDNGECRPKVCTLGICSGSIFVQCQPNGSGYSSWQTCNYGDCIGYCDAKLGCQSKPVPSGTACGAGHQCNSSGKCVCDDPTKSGPTCKITKTLDLKACTGPASGPGDGYGGSELDLIRGQAVLLTGGSVALALYQRDDLPPFQKNGDLILVINWFPNANALLSTGNAKIAGNTQQYTTKWTIKSSAKWCDLKLTKFNLATAPDACDGRITGTYECPFGSSTGTMTGDFDLPVSFAESQLAAPPCKRDGLPAERGVLQRVV